MYVIWLLTAAPKRFLLVRKSRAQDAVREEAARCNMFFVNERWLGGMMTNFKNHPSAD